MNVNGNIRIALLGDIVTKIPLFIITLMTIRLLDVDNFANYSFAIATFTMISSAVASIFNIAFIVDSKAENSNYLWFEIFLVFLVSSILALFSNFYDGLFPYVFLLLLFHIIFIFNQSVEQKRLNFIKFYSYEFVRVALFLFIVLAFYFASVEKESKLQADDIFLAQIIATGIPAIVALLLSSSVRPKMHGIITLAKYLFRLSGRYLLIYFFVLSMVLSVDFLMLRLFARTHDLTDFGAAFRYYAILQMVLVSIKKVVFPTVAGMTDLKKIRMLLNNNLRQTIKFIWAMPVILIVSPFLIPILDGGKYPNSITIFMILACSAYLSLLFSPFATLMIKYEYYNKLASIVFKMLFFHCILSYMFIKNYGGHGAALANLISYGVLNYWVFKSSQGIVGSLDKSDSAR